MAISTARAFIFRIAPSGIDHLREGLDYNQIIIGWSAAGEQLLDQRLTWADFREIVRSKCYQNDNNLRKVGQGAGHLWRFIREMNTGDLVVVPHSSGFYVAEVKGDAYYDPTKLGNDTAYRRNVLWRNQKQPMPRDLAPAALLSRMKIQGSSADATALLDEITECLELAKSGSIPTFTSDLKAILVQATRNELLKGRMGERAFERLIRDVLVKLGAKEARVIDDRKEDKGADVVATFLVAGAISIRVAVQAKYWQPEKGSVGPDVVEQLIHGIEAEDADLGIVVTSSTISDEAVAKAEAYYQDSGVRIQLMDGDALAMLIVEFGIEEEPIKTNLAALKATT